MRAKKTVFILCLLLLASGIFSLDLHLRPRAFMLFPLGKDSSDSFSFGGGGEVLLDVDISSILGNPWGLGYGAGIEGAFGGAGLSEGAEGTLSLLSGGLGFSLFYYPISRLALRMDGAFGIYRGSLGDDASGSWYSRIGAEAGFRFTPNFILSLNTGWKHYHNAFAGEENSPRALVQGMYLGLTGQIILELRSSGNRDQGIGLELIQGDPVYPLFYSLYQVSPAADIRLRNNESAEIRDVRMSFRAGSYSSSEFPCGEIGRIGKGQAADMPLYADFSPEILNFTENGRVAGEVVIRYRLLGREREAVLPAALRVLNRNSFPGNIDWMALSAYVSPSSPEILEFSKYVTGLARSDLHMGLNGNMQFGMWLFEGLRAASLHVLPAAASSSGPMEVQFPSQTLAYKSGSAGDLGLLYAAALESAGIASAIIPYEGGFITLLSLGISEAAAASLFRGPERVAVVNDEVWLPLAMDAAEEGFTAAWDRAVEELDRLYAAGESVEFIILRDAWTVYPPVPFPALGVRISQPDTEKLRSGTSGALNSYIASDIIPLLNDTQRLVQQEGTAASYNRLGLLQVRAGKLSEAKASYERAARMGSAAAMINRGNLAVHEEKRSEAENWYRQALELQPENAAALRALQQLTAKGEQ